jgi:biotin carboxylase
MQSDIGVPTVAAVNQVCGGAGVTPDVALACSNKIVMRETLAAAGVCQPTFAVVRDVQEAVEAAHRIGYPCMVKAPDSSGSRGVIKVRCAGDVEAALVEARSWSRDDRLLVESCIEGHELGAQSFHIHGVCQLVLVHNDTMATGPYPVPTGHSFPVILSQQQIHLVQEQCARAGEALGIRHGPVNLDLMIDASGSVHILEVGARIGATCLPELVYHHTGIDWIEAGVLAAVGDSPLLSIQKEKVVAARILESPVDGLLKAYEANDALLKRPELIEWEVVAPVGSRVSRLRKGPDRIGKVLATGSDVDHAVAFVEEFAASLRLDVEKVV